MAHKNVSRGTLPALINLPKHPSGRIDTTKLKEIYDASPYINIAELCDKYGWDLANVLRAIPYRKWRQEKSYRVMRERGEEINLQMLEAGQTVREETFKCLVESPKRINKLNAQFDLFMDILDSKLEKHKLRRQQGWEDEGLEQERAELFRQHEQLISAARNLHKAKQESLLLDKLQIDDPNKLLQSEIGKTIEAEVNNVVTYKVVGYEQGVTEKDLEGIFKRYSEPALVKETPDAS